MASLKDTQEKTGFDIFADRFSRLMVGLCVCIFAVMVFSVSYGVVGRYLPFVRAPRWTQELAILCMVWLCFVGAGAAVKDGRHVRMTIIESIVPKSWIHPLRLFAYVVLVIVNLFWVVYGIQTTILSHASKMSATGWPLSVTYLSLVIGGLYGAVMAVYRIRKGVDL